MDIDGDGGRRAFGPRGQHRGTESDKGTAANLLSEYDTPGLNGFQHESEFFFCATNFDAKRSNETGLSNTELHTLLRSAEADLVVKVIDACSSGSLLIKSDGSFISTNKQAFKNLIHIASWLDSQSSLAVQPLSLFTDKFRTACLREAEGAMYYTDIIDGLRDEFLDNYIKATFCFSRTGREQFVEAAKRLDGLRAKLSALGNRTDTRGNVPSVIAPPPSAFDILNMAEKNLPEGIK